MIALCLIRTAMLEAGRLVNVSVRQLSFARALTETRLFLKFLLSTAEVHSGLPSTQHLCNTALSIASSLNQAVTSHVTDSNIEKEAMNPKEKITQILLELDRVYPQARCALQFKNPLELLIATILSAQCTDKRVNEVTKTLFKKYKTPQDYAQAPLTDLEEDIRPTGFFHNKAKNIQGCCRELIKRHHGKVPQTMEELVALPGIGRKTANVVLGNAFGIPGIVVDTHVGRIAQRLGLTREKDPVKIEFALMPLIPEKHWTIFSHQMIEHGRSLCMARAPQCLFCFLRPFCDFGNLETNHPRGGRS